MRRRSPKGVRAIGGLVVLWAVTSACAFDWDKLEPTGGAGGVGGGATTGSQGGAGGGSSGCAPGTTAACYTGPDGTLGVGVCRAGVATCVEDGSRFGPCEGEVTPTAEDCATPEDDDCDGRINQPEAGCTCAPLALEACYEGPEGTEGVGACRAGERMCHPDGLGVTVCAGQVLPRIEECGSTTVDDDCDGEVNEGCPLWALRFNATSSSFHQAPSEVAIGSSGDIYLVGHIAGVVNLGGGNLAAQGGRDVFVTRRGPDGSHLWSRRYGDELDEEALAVAVDSAGASVVVGTFAGGIDFGLGALSADGTDGFILKLDPAGDPVWQVHLTSTGQLAPYAVALDANGDVYVTGEFAGSTNLGAGSVSATVEDGFLLALDASGSHRWSTTFGTLGRDVGWGLAVDGTRLYVTGSFSSQVTFGSQTANGQGGLDGFLARLSTTDGSASWVRAVGPGNDQALYYPRVAPNGDIVAYGDFAGSINFGEGVIDSAGGDDLVLFRVTPDNELVWGQTFGGPGDQNAWGLAVDAEGDIWFAVEHEGRADYGFGEVVSLGNDDAVYVKLDGAGAYKHMLRFGDQHSQDARSIAVDAAGNVIAPIECRGTIHYGVIESSGNSSYDDICLTKLPPE